MPVTYTIDPKEHCVRTKVAGPITVGEICGHFEAAERERVLHYAELIDAREVAPPFLSSKEIWQAANWVREQKLQSFGPRAVIVANDWIFGMTRIFTTVVSGFFPIEVFRDEKAALTWLARRWPDGTANK